MRTGSVFGKICVLFLTVCLGLSFPGNYSHATENTKNMLKEAQQQKKSTEAKLKQTNENIDAMEDQKDSLEDTLEDLNGQLTEVSEAIAGLEKDISDKEQDIEATQKALGEARLSLKEAEDLRDSQYENMKRQIRVQYECGNKMYMDLLLNTAEFGDELNRADYIEAFSGYQSGVLDDFKKAEQAIRDRKAFLEKLESTLVKQKEDLDSDKNEVQLQQDRITDLVSSTEGSITKFSDAISSAEAEALAYEEQIEQQNNDIAKLKAQLAEEERMIALAKQSAWRNIKDVSFAADDRALLAAIIHCEAGNQPYEGQVAVGSVVMNRVRSAVFPNTIVGVIYQKGQFSPVASGRLALALAKGSASQSCYSAADAAMAGQSPVADCLYFRAPVAGKVPRYTIGGHIFY